MQDQNALEARMMLTIIFVEVFTEEWINGSSVVAEGWFENQCELSRKFALNVQILHQWRRWNLNVMSAISLLGLANLPQQLHLEWRTYSYTATRKHTTKSYSRAGGWVAMTPPRRTFKLCGIGLISSKLGHFIYRTRLSGIEKYTYSAFNNQH